MQRSTEIVTEKSSNQSGCYYFHTIDFPYYLSTPSEKRSDVRLAMFTSYRHLAVAVWRSPFFLQRDCQTLCIFFLWPYGASGCNSPTFIEWFAKLKEFHGKWLIFLTLSTKKMASTSYRASWTTARYGDWWESVCSRWCRSGSEGKGIDDFITLAEEWITWYHFVFGAVDSLGITDGYERYKDYG